MVAPVFRKLADKADAEKVAFAKVDVDALPDAAQEVAIRAVSASAATADAPVLVCRRPSERR